MKIFLKTYKNQTQIIIKFQPKKKKSNKPNKHKYRVLVSFSTLVTIKFKLPTSCILSNLSPPNYF